MTSRGFLVSTFAVLSVSIASAAVVRSMSIQPATGHSVREVSASRAGEVTVFLGEEVRIAAAVWTKGGSAERSVASAQWIVTDAAGRLVGTTVEPISDPKRTESDDEGTVRQEFRINGLREGQFDIVMSLPETPDARSTRSFPVYLRVARGDESPAVRELPTSMPRCGD